MNYIEMKCEICDKDFVDGDDIVVCPECGTPMHRACYFETNVCPNAEKHNDGFVYKPTEKISLHKVDGGLDEKAKRRPAQSPSTLKICSVCGGKNRKGAHFCDNCGAAFLENTYDIDFNNNENIDLNDPEQFMTFMINQAADIPPNTEYDEHVTAGDLACFIALNTPYYLRAFRRIKEGAKKFNFSAAIFSGVWFIYRKLYKVGALLLSIEVLLYSLKIYFTQTLSLEVMNKLLATIGLTASQIPQLTMEQYMQLSVEMQKLPFNEQLLMFVPTILLIMQLVLMFVSGGIANKLYYKRCVEKIGEVKKLACEQSLSPSETAHSLYFNGGVNGALAGLFGLIYVLLLFM